MSLTCASNFTNPADREPSYADEQLIQRIHDIYDAFDKAAAVMLACADIDIATIHAYPDMASEAAYKLTEELQDCGWSFDRSDYVFPFLKQIEDDYAASEAKRRAS